MFFFHHVQFVLFSDRCLSGCHLRNIISDHHTILMKIGNSFTYLVGCEEIMSSYMGCVLLRAPFYIWNNNKLMRGSRVFWLSHESKVAKWDHCCTKSKVSVDGGESWVIDSTHHNPQQQTEQTTLFLIRNRYRSSSADNSGYYMTLFAPDAAEETANTGSLLHLLGRKWSQIQALIE